MPVNTDGTARASFDTDRFRITDLFGRDGTNIVHARPDNHAKPDRPPYLAGRDDPCNGDWGTASPAAPSSPLSRN